MIAVLLILGLTVLYAAGLTEAITIFPEVAVDWSSGWTWASPLAGLVLSTLTTIALGWVITFVWMTLALLIGTAFATWTLR